MIVAGTITLGSWEFAWAERVLAGQAGLVQIWPTVWRVEAGALPALQRLFGEHGARWPDP